jgi:hypothetical protein
MLGGCQSLPTILPRSDPKIRLRKKGKSDFYLKFWAKYLGFHHADSRVAAPPDGISRPHQ